MIQTWAWRGALSIALSSATFGQQPWVERATVTSSGVESHGLVDAPALSADGRFVAFASDAADLVLGDTNNAEDVFVRDRLTGTTERVSVANGSGAESNGRSFHAAISGDGRYVAFTSAATNLTPNTDLNGGYDVFVRDRATQTTRLVSVASPTQPTGGMTGIGGSWSPSISADGRWVAFYSGGYDLVPPGVDQSPYSDAFVADLVNSTITLVSLSSAGGPGDWHNSESPEIPGCTGVSDDGRFVVFLSQSSTLVPGAISGLSTVYVRDTLLNTTDVVAYVAPGQPSIRTSSAPSISGNGRYVVFYCSDPALVPGDTNNATDVFVRDLVAGTTERVNVDSIGAQAFYSGPPQLALVGRSSISHDGRFVAFETLQQNLVPGDVNAKTDVFVHDRVEHVTQLVSRSLVGRGGNSGSYRPALSAAGGLVAFQSDAANLVTQDLNAKPDVFVAVVPTSATTFCAGDGSATACPCGNLGGVGRGCANSVDPAGARLTTTGGASVAADLVSLVATGLPPGTVAAIFQGLTQHLGGAGAPFGDGLRCVGGTVTRLGTRNPTASGNLAFGHGVGGDPHVATQGLVGPAGGTRTYQIYYRNVANYCTSATFNLTNGVEIAWLP